MICNHSNTFFTKTKVLRGDLVTRWAPAFVTTVSVNTSVLPRTQNLVFMYNAFVNI